ncbi:WD40 repeat-like protein [Hesseltinella vesiculosa]|uniref:WD40 repeat-like protein n=1 Tax=Hesseltinella vesiculosa TaxID=101127 RepID=A0A1X2G9M7_9FUNG|nr:WD40 repeat-like protein [Hesseltinella vesiculosa]
MSAPHPDQHPDQPVEDEIDEEYLNADDVEEVAAYEDGGEPMDSDEEQENPLEGYEMRPSETDENVMELADDSIQGFFAHGEPVYAVAMHPKDNTIIVTGGGDDKSYVWQAASGEKIYELDGHTDSVTAVAFSVEGDYVASAGMDGRIRVWRMDNGELCASVEGPDEVVWINWHPKGNVLLAGANDATIWMWAMPSGKFMNIFNGHSGPVTAGGFTPDGKKIVSVSEDSTMIIWDPKTAAAEFRLSSDDARFHAESITSLAINRDSTLAISGDMEGKARLINITSGSIVASLENHADSVESISFCDILPLAATGSVDGTISIWDTQTHRLRSTLQHDDAIIKVRFVKNAPYLVSCSADRTVRMWDARTAQCVKVWQGHRDAVLDIAVSDDGAGVVTASDDGHCLVFHV